MKLVMLPGMDGTGKLFQPLVHELPENIESTVISYPCDKILSLEELVQYIVDRLPVSDEYVLLAESYSGPLGYMIAQRKPENLRGVIFVASFLRSPRKFLAMASKSLPLPLLFSLPIPNTVIRHFFLGNNISEEIITLFKEAVNEVGGDILASRLQQIAQLKPELEKLDTDTFYIQATNDKLVTPDNIDSFYKITDALNVFKIHGPHFVLQANPKDCSEVIVKVLKNT